jgi:hypothetical protein
VYELEIKGTMESAISASFQVFVLHADTNDILTTTLYDKCDDFNFAIVNFTYLQAMRSNVKWGGDKNRFSWYGAQKLWIGIKNPKYQKGIDLQTL